MRFSVHLTRAALFVFSIVLQNSFVFGEVLVDNPPPQITSIALSVDELSGAAVQSVPIEVPPGVGGIAPQVSLVYNSSRQPGLLGSGWSLELGAIERSTRRGVPQYNDNDLFFLIQSGGRQELVYDAAAGFYRGRIEGAFLKIVKIKKPAV